MRCRTWFVLSLALIACRPTEGTTESWQDPSRHTVRMVRVDPTTRLETLDWGGPGPVVVMLAGLGNTAHVFDGLAPQLTDSFHVVGITRRGFGASDQPPAVTLQMLVDDLKAVLDSLGHQQVILIGHSIAGDELSAFAAEHPDRTAALVYLDAAYDRTGLPQLFQTTPIPPIPAMSASDSASPAAARAYLNRHFNLEMPESEVRATTRFDSSGRYAGSVTPDSLAGGIVLALPKPAYERITAPALAIYAASDSVQTIIPYYAGLDSAGRAAAERILPAFQSLSRASIDQFRRSVRDSEVLEIRGANHYVFMSHEAETLRAIRAFLARAIIAGRAG